MRKQQEIPCFLKAGAFVCTGSHAPQKSSWLPITSASIRSSSSSMSPPSEDSDRDSPALAPIPFFAAAAPPAALVAAPPPALDVLASPGLATPAADAADRGLEVLGGEGVGVEEEEELEDEDPSLLLSLLFSLSFPFSSALADGMSLGAVAGASLGAPPAAAAPAGLLEGGSERSAVPTAVDVEATAAAVGPLPAAGSGEPGLGVVTLGVVLPEAAGDLGADAAAEAVPEAAGTPAAAPA